MRKVVLLAGAMALSAPLQAAETITYTYDARGRLIAVQRIGTVNNNANRTYTVDKAENRTNKTTTGSPNPPP